jgi:hypothetical protein
LWNECANLTAHYFTTRGADAALGIAARWMKNHADGCGESCDLQSKVNYARLKKQAAATTATTKQAQKQRLPGSMNLNRPLQRQR